MAKSGQADVRLVPKGVHSSPILAYFGKVLALDCHNDTFEEILLKVKKLSGQSKLGLLGICERAFKELRFRADEPTRVAASKVCVALLPDSLAAIRKWLNRKSGRHIYEVHFSLFVVFDKVQHEEVLIPFKRQILELVENYLMHSDRESAQAAWMAGELLGDDWQLSESLPILTNLVQNGLFVSGRKAALHGLSEVLHKSEKTVEESIIALVQQVAKNDGSKKVRDCAKLLLTKSAVSEFREGVMKGS